MIIKIVMV